MAAAFALEVLEGAEVTADSSDGVYPRLEVRAATAPRLYAAVTAAPTVTQLPTHVSHSTLVAHYSLP